MYDYFKIDEKLLNIAEKAETEASPFFQRVERIQRYNQQKMLAAFSQTGVSESHFTPTTGYGYGDRGREALDRVYAHAFGAEDALVRYQFTSGTHTLAVALFGVLRPGDRMLCVTGLPYDTLHGVIGLNGNHNGSLMDFGIAYDQIELTPEGLPDYEAIEASAGRGYKLVYIQRSRGYSLRPSLSVETIEQIIAAVRRKAPDCIVMVDNCYGEFVEEREPVAVGADLIVGSLIKNPGGGIAPTGGYIAGRQRYVELCAYRLTTSATGREVGCSLENNRAMFMGAFHAPHVTGEAVKTAIFAASLFSRLGFSVTPRPEEPRTDIIAAILLEQPEALIAFCRGIQKGAPVDSFVTPEPWEMPGYDSKVIMAAGAFIQGASIELSADAPLRPPYAVWMQGGLNYHSGQMGVLLAAQEMLSSGALRLDAKEQQV